MKVLSYVHEMFCRTSSRHTSFLRHFQGALCEEPVEISQPSFTTSVGGYSSYLAHSIDPASVSRAFEAQFHFSHAAGHRHQVALMLFLGQEGVHEFGSDYVAVSYVKGHVLGWLHAALCHFLHHF